jgi:hypothetical protein
MIRSFEDRIAQAIGDPGSVVGNRIHTSFGDDRDETITRWATRAVLAVSEDRRVQLRDAHNDLLNVRGLLSPQGRPDVTPVPLVPTVAPAVEWLIAENERLREQLDEIRAAHEEATL